MFTDQATPSLIDADLVAANLARLSALRSLNILDTPSEDRFDRITRLVARVLKVPIVLISLVDEQRQWFKSRVGIDIEQTPLQMSLCKYAVASKQLLLVLGFVLAFGFAHRAAPVAQTARRARPAHWRPWCHSQTWCRPQG